MDPRVSKNPAQFQLLTLLTLSLKFVVVVVVVLTYAGCFIPVGVDCTKNAVLSREWGNFNGFTEMTRRKTKCLLECTIHLTRYSHCLRT